MARFEIIQLLVCLWITSSVSADSSCPSGESIRPCYCIQEPSGYKTVICNELDNAEDLRNVTTHFKSVVIDRFHILGSFNKLRSIITKSSYYPYETSTMVVVPETLPHHWLNYVRVVSLDINNSSLINCFLCDNPLEGQEEFLLSLTVTHSLHSMNYIVSENNGDANDTTLLNTRNLRHMKKLMSLDLSYNHIVGLFEEAFPSTLKSLERIVLAHNDIRWMESNAFWGLTSLRQLDVSYNQLRNFATFTYLIHSLQLLDASWNYVSSLEIHSFDNMTELTDIRLNNNNIELLPASSFRGLTKESVDIHVRGNFIICDCNLSWIAEKNFRIFGTCASPEEVAFRQISTALPTLRNCSAPNY